jgi:hypothetical protein
MPRKKLCRLDDERVDMFLPLFCRDFLMSTIGWTAAQRGHYLTLLMVQWDGGGLPPDLEHLERISGGVSEHWELLENKFPVGTDGQRRNMRLEEHRKAAVEIRQKRRENGKKGGKPNGVPNGVPNGYPSGTQMGAHPGVHPEPEPEPEPQSLSKERDTGSPVFRSSDGDPSARQAGHAVTAWESLLSAWNAAAGRCKHIARFDSLHPPRAFHDRYDELAWQEDWRRGVERLERCRWFTTPVSLTFFLKEDTLASILAGQYDPKKPTRPGDQASAGPVVSTRMWRDDACQNMTDEQYAAWRRTQKGSPVASTANITEEDL